MIILFAIPFLILVPAVYYISDPSKSIIFFIVLLLTCVAFYWYSPKIMLRWYKCQTLGPENEKMISALLFPITSKLSIPYPKVYTFDSSVPIAFTVGVAKRYAIVLSKNTFDIMDEDELKMVLACEAAKIRDGSVPINTVVSLIAGSIISMSTIIMWMAMLAGFGQEKDIAPRIARFLALGLVSLPAALIVHLFGVNSVLRSDEIALLNVKNEKLFRETLKRMNNYIELHCTENFNPGHVNIFLINPLKVKDLFDIYSSMFIIKPDLEYRIKTIENKYG